MEVNLYLISVWQQNIPGKPVLSNNKKYQKRPFFKGGGGGREGGGNTPETIEI